MNRTIDWKNHDIYKFVYNELLPKFNQQYSTVPRDIKETVKSLKKLCNENTHMDDSLVDCFNEMNL